MVGVVRGRRWLRIDAVPLGRGVFSVYEVIARPPFGRLEVPFVFRGPIDAPSDPRLSPLWTRVVTAIPTYGRTVAVPSK
jgi:hypothetical protein